MVVKQITATTALDRRRIQGQIVENHIRRRDPPARHLVDTRASPVPINR